MERILRQKDHMAMALKGLEQMYINGHDYDTTIICSDGELGAHFFVLRIFSSFAEDVEWIHDQGMIFFPRATKSDIQRILDIIYLGKTTVQKNDVKRIIETASLMKINVQEETCDDQDSETPDLLTFSCRGDQNVQSSEVNENDEDEYFSLESHHKKLSSFETAPEFNQPVDVNLEPNTNCGKTPVCESTSNPLIGKNVTEPLPSTTVSISTGIRGQPALKKRRYIISSSDSEDQDETTASNNTSRPENDSALSSENINQRKPAWITRRKQRTDAPQVTKEIETAASKDTSRHQNDTASSSKNTNQRKPAWIKRRKKSTDAQPVIQGIETEDEPEPISQNPNPFEPTVEIIVNKTSLEAIKNSRPQNDTASPSKNMNRRKPAWIIRRKQTTDPPQVTQEIETAEESSIIRTKAPSTATEILQMCRRLRKEPMPEELRRNILERKIDITNFCVKCRKNCHTSHFKEHSRNPGKREQCRLCRKFFYNDVLMRIHLPCRGCDNL